MGQKSAEVEVRELFDLDHINPNPYQPAERLEGDPEIVEKLAGSIERHGLLQIPIGRRQGKNVELGDGWLRYLAYKKNYLGGLTDFAQMPVMVKEITGQQMADMVIEANTVRKDLSPFAEAEIYKRYLEEFNVTQKELAESHSCSQGEIANTIRLLELPDSLKAKVLSGELPRTHARQLLRLSRFPEKQEKAAIGTIKYSQTVNQLADDINRTLWDSSKSVNPRNDMYDAPEFDVSKCKDCEFREMVARPYYGDRGKEARCLKPECWEKENAAAIKAKVKKAEVALKKKGIKEKVLTNNDLEYNQHEDLREAHGQLDNPEECKTCEKVVLFKYNLTDTRDPWRVCTDPACFRKKKTKKTKDSNKQAKIDDRALTVKLGETFQHVGHSPKECMLVLARHTLPRLSADGKRDIVAMFELPKISNGQLDMDALLVSLAGKSLNELTQLTVAATITISRRSTYAQYSTTLDGEIRRDMAIISGSMDKYVAEITAFQEANCRGCQTCKDDLIIGTGEECCNFIYSKHIGEDGKCTSRRDRRIEVPEEASAVETENEEVTGGASKG